MLICIKYKSAIKEGSRKRGAFQNRTYALYIPPDKSENDIDHFQKIPGYLKRYEHVVVFFEDSFSNEVSLLTNSLSMTNCPPATETTVSNVEAFLNITDLTGRSEECYEVSA